MARTSAGVVVVRPDSGLWRYLLLRAFRYWDFPKGNIEAGETPFEAASREVAEETGITDLVFRWDHVYHETAPYRHNKIARYYVAETSSAAVHLSVNPELGRPEHHEWRWVTRSEAERLLGDRVRAALLWAANIIGDV